MTLSIDVSGPSVAQCLRCSFSVPFDQVIWLREDDTRGRLVAMCAMCVGCFNTEEGNHATNQIKQ
jgi:hypothetical protein